MASATPRYAQKVERSPRDQILYQVLERARFRPAVKRAAAAAELGISYSNFRRHLTAATHRLTELLWEAASTIRTS